MCCALLWLAGSHAWDDREPRNCCLACALLQQTRFTRVGENKQKDRRARLWMAFQAVVQGEICEAQLCGYCAFVGALIGQN